MATETHVDRVTAQRKFERQERKRKLIDWLALRDSYDERGSVELRDQADRQIREAHSAAEIKSARRA